MQTFPNPLNLDDILTYVHGSLKRSRLLPDTISIDTEVTMYKSPGTGLGNCFFGIHFYWDESYFDKLQMGTKLDTLQEDCNDWIPTIPAYCRKQWGASDGHLFVYIDLQLTIPANMR
jgi:hypothetical protein